jgi:hypothetical protein
MNRHNPHIDQHSRFFKEKQIPYSRSKEDVWNDMMANIQEKKGHKSNRKNAAHILVRCCRNGSADRTYSVPAFLFNHLQRSARPAFIHNSS